MRSHAGEERLPSGNPRLGIQTESGFRETDPEVWNHEQDTGGSGGPLRPGGPARLRGRIPAVRRPRVDGAPFQRRPRQGRHPGAHQPGVRDARGGGLRARRRPRDGGLHARRRQGLPREPGVVARGHQRRDRRPVHLGDALSAHRHRPQLRRHRRRPRADRVRRLGAADQQQPRDVRPPRRPDPLPADDLHRHQRQLHGREARAAADRRDHLGDVEEDVPRHRGGPGGNRPGPLRQRQAQPLPAGGDLRDLPLRHLPRGSRQHLLPDDHGHAGSRRTHPGEGDRPRDLPQRRGQVVPLQ